MIFCRMKRKKIDANQICQMHFVSIFPINILKFISIHILYTLNKPYNCLYFSLCIYINCKVEGKISRSIDKRKKTKIEVFSSPRVCEWVSRCTSNNLKICLSDMHRRKNSGNVSIIVFHPTSPLSSSLSSQEHNLWILCNFFCSSF